MHARNLVARNDHARARIRAAADTLAEVLGVPQLGQPSTIEQRQEAIAQMRELEELAVLLENVTGALAGEIDHG